MIAFTSLLHCLLTFCDGSGFQCFGGLSVFKGWFKQFSNLNTWISPEGRWDSAVILQAVVQTGSSTKDKEYVSQTTSLLLLGDRLIDQHWTHARKKKKVTLVGKQEKFQFLKYHQFSFKFSCENWEDVFVLFGLLQILGTGIFKEL